MKHYLFILALLSIFILGLNIVGFAQDNVTTQNNEVTKESANKEKIQHIRKLIEVTIGNNIGKQIISNMLEITKQRYPKVPQEFWAQFEEEIDLNEFMELMIPIYEKRFTDEDIVTITNFYETPTGQKMIKSLPAVFKDASAMGQEYGQRIGRRIIEKLKDKGYEERKY